MKVDGGTGNDLIVVGNTTHGVNDIRGISRPNLDQPDGVGAVQVVGGSGHDTLIVDDSHDTTSTNETGRITSFLEHRQSSGPQGDEIGLVVGLGMEMFPSSQSFHDNPSSGFGAGRVEFEGVEALDVRLGQGGTTLAIGGDAGLLGTGADALPQGRQSVIIGFTSTPSAAVTVEGGSGNDTIRVFGTNTVDRDILNSTGFLRVSTIQDGVPTISDEQQLLVMPTGVFGWFTLTYNGHTTAQLQIGASASDIQTALRGLTGLNGVHTVTVTQPIGGTFLLDFDKALGDARRSSQPDAAVIVNNATSQELDLPTRARPGSASSRFTSVSTRRPTAQWTQRPPTSRPRCSPPASPSATSSAPPASSPITAMA